MMRILAVGGGSGGHVTPVLAVINELKKHDAALEVFFICDRGFGAQAEMMMAQAAVPVTTRRVFAGKFRRYYGVSWARQLLDIPTTLLNIRDTLLILLGTLQSAYHVIKWHPDVVFTKGGFVCLPVGLAAHLFKVPLVIHDSDAHPGLTNRVLARWATSIATGAPLENYSYPKDKSTYVGIPVDVGFRPFDAKEQQQAKADLGLPDTTKPLIAVTGGGLGARRVNDAIVSIAGELVEKAAIVHVTGKNEFDAVSKKAVQHAAYKILPFVHDGMAKVLGAADIVVIRAGATSLLEAAALGKATVIIPNAMLTGGHQLKNAKVYADAQAAVVIDERELAANPGLLLQELNDLLQNDTRRKDYAKRMYTFAKPQAALDMAEIIVSAVPKK